MKKMLENKPNRKRITDISYKDKEYVPYFDIDKKDFESIVLKLNKGVSLSKEENKRYGEYVLAVTESILEGPRFRAKPIDEKEELRDKIYFEILTQVPAHYKEPRGTIYNYSYRCGYLAAVHYYTDQVKGSKRYDDALEGLNDWYKERNNEVTYVSEWIFKRQL